jgi:hypothetical protein
MGAAEAGGGGAAVAAGVGTGAAGALGAATGEVAGAGTSCALAPAQLSARPKRPPAIVTRNAIIEGPTPHRPHA